MKLRSAPAAVVARLGASRAFRAWQRYGEARGNVLAAGVGYFAFFSIFPATALAFSIFGFFLRDQPGLVDAIADQLNQNLPGFVKDAEHPEGIIAIKAPTASALTITGVIAFVTLVLAGLGWLGAVRDGVRGVFGLPGSEGNLITNKLRDLGVLFTLGLGIATFAVLSGGVGAAASWIAARLGMSGQEWLLTVASFGVSILADTGLMMLLLRVVSGVFVPWRVLLPGALVGGVGFSLLKISAGTLLPRVTDNPLFASLAIVVGLLFWLNLIARLTLISAAWVANDVEKAYGGTFETATQGLRQRRSDSRGRSGGNGTKGNLEPVSPIAHSGQPLKSADTEESADTGDAQEAQDTRDTQRTGRAAIITSANGTGSGSTTLPTFGARAGDRATLGAGMILGAAAVAGTGALRRGIQSLLRLARH